MLSGKFPNAFCRKKSPNSPNGCATANRITSSTMEPSSSTVQFGPTSPSSSPSAPPPPSTARPQHEHQGPRLVAGENAEEARRQQELSARDDAEERETARVWNLKSQELLELCLQQSPSRGRLEGERGGGVEAASADVTAGDASEKIAMHAKCEIAGHDATMEDASRGPTAPKYLQGLEPGGTLPGAYDVHAVGAISGAAFSVTSQSGLDEEEPTIAMEAEMRNTTTNDVFIATTFRAPDAVEDLLLIDGVKSIDPRVYQRRAIAGFLVLIALVAVAVGMITHRLVNLSTTKTVAPASAPKSITMAPTSNLNWTLADRAISSRLDNRFVSSPFISQVFLNRFNRTDTNFTFFAVERGVNLFQGYDVDFISQFSGPSWVGHLVSVEKSGSQWQFRT